MSELLPCPHHEDAIYPRQAIWKNDGFCLAIYRCPECGWSFSDTGKTKEAAIDSAARGWNTRWEPTTRRIIKGDDETRYAWCEAGEHEMNPTGEYCEHCGRKVVK